jgi:hypothetical protein
MTSSGMTAKTAPMRRLFEEPLKRLQAVLLVPWLVLARSDVVESASPVLVAHHAVSTRNAAAQQAFDEGLTLYYAYNRGEARRRFERAAALDPQLAAAQWGIALACGPNYNETSSPGEAGAGIAALAAARRLEPRASAEERALISALTARYADDDPNGPRETRAYAEAMRGVAASFPSDGDAAVLAAEPALELAEADPRGAAVAREAGRLAAVLRRDPRHVGANHLYIHAVESSSAPLRALPSARFLSAAALDPAASHLRHVGSHIYVHSGDWAAIVRDNRRAAAADASYAAHGGTSDGDPARLFYYGHNVSFWLGAALVTGDLAEAARPADILRRYGSSDTLFLAYRARSWNRILGMPVPAGDPASVLVLRYYRGLAFAATGRVREARAELAAYSKAAAGPASSDPALAVYAEILSAKVFVAGGEFDRGVRLYRDLARRQDRAGLESMPVWFYPIGEWLGEAYLKFRRYPEAEGAFRADLRRYPHAPRTLYGLYLSLKAEGNTKEADRALEEVSFTWKGATAPQLGDSL